MTINLNAPIYDYAVCLPAGPAQTPQQSQWLSLLERSEPKFTWKRGKQYELDQVQPGEAQLTIRNLDGAFDPGNAASPFAGYVIPYRLFRARAQWPPTQNLLTGDQATAGLFTNQPAGTLISQVSLYGITASQYATAPLSGATNEYEVGFAASPALYTGLSFAGWSVTPGTTYSASAQCNQAGTGLSAYLAIQWFAADGVTIVGTTNGPVTPLGSAAVTLSVTSTAPANAAGGRLLWLNGNSPATATTMGLWQIQVEKAAAPTAYTLPGTWYNLFTGYIERWPQKWSSSGNYGTVDLTVVDLFAWYANQAMSSPFVADLLDLNPNFLYPLNEKAGSASFADLTNKRGPIAITQNAVQNTIMSGTSLQSADNAPTGADGASGIALTGAYLGDPGPVATSALPKTGSAGLNTGAFLSIPANPATGIVGPPPNGNFTRIIAARATGFNPAASALTIMCGTFTGVGITPLKNYICMALTASEPSIVIVTPTENEVYGMPGMSNIATAGSSVVTDQDWHLYAYSFNAGGTHMRLWCDSEPGGVLVTTYNQIPTFGSNAQGHYDVIGAGADNGAAFYEWIGDLAFCVELPFEMTNAVWGVVAASWRNAWGTTANNTETSDVRYRRILAWADYTGPMRISPGLCTSVGPASDITGLAVLEALQAVVDTENGQHFIGADGVPVFQSRGDRYSRTPIATFGEAPGEIPYTDAQTDFDPTRIANDIQLTTLLGNTLYRATDGPQSNPATSQGKYGTITLQRTVNSVSANEMTAAAQYLLYQNKDPLTRIEAVPFRPSANPSIFPTLLGLDLGSCVAFNRRPSNAPQISLTGFVEQISGVVDGANKSVEITLQVSNNAKQQVWKVEDPVLGAPDQTTVGY